MVERLPMRPECINVSALSANEGSGTAGRLLVTPATCFPKGEEDIYPFAFCLAAQRAFINTDNFFLAAALIGGRLLAFLGADFPFHFAHRCFIAAEIRLRAAALILRRRGVIVGVAFDFGGRPRRGADEPASPSSAEIAWSRRFRSAFKSETKFWMSIESFQML